VDVEGQAVHRDEVAVGLVVVLHVEEGWGHEVV
jgi:hypothetical protein